MGLLNKKSAGGFMDEIRCDEPSYLIWKWRPAGSQPGNRRENAIRWGSSLRVRDGSVAVFVYKQKDGTMQDFIEGPYDLPIETKNFPILASIVGLAYAGGTPFQAEVYFINLAQIIQVKFAVPFFDVFDPRFLDFGVPTAVRGTLSFRITDYREFIKLHRLDSFNLDDFQTQIRDAVSRNIKGVVANAPADYNIPLVQIERKTKEINEMVETELSLRLKETFGVTVSGADIGAIEIDKTSDGYKQLIAVTQDVATATVQAQTNVNIRNLYDMQRINAENMDETLRIQREEAQYAQHKQTQSVNMAAYQLEQQAAVGIAGANALGQMGASGAGSMSGGDMNPAAMMAGMAMGGAIGQNMAVMMHGMMAGVNAPTSGATPPPVPAAAYYVAVNEQASGPYDMTTLGSMVTAGTLAKGSLVWKQGMENWVRAETVQELQAIFGSVPPVPPMPPTP